MDAGGILSLLAIFVCIEDSVLCFGSGYIPLDAIFSVSAQHSAPPDRARKTSANRCSQRRCAVLGDGDGPEHGLAEGVVAAVAALDLRPLPIVQTDLPAPQVPKNVIGIFAAVGLDLDMLRQPPGGFIDPAFHLAPAHSQGVIQSGDALIDAAELLTQFQIIALGPGILHKLLRQGSDGASGELRPVCDLPLELHQLPEMLDLLRLGRILLLQCPVQL